MGKLERPLPYERRAKKAGAGIVKPGEPPPAGAKKWSRWSLRQHRRAGQEELFPGQDLGESPDVAWEREHRRLWRASGGSSTIRGRFEKEE
jgi:hypothetical protein